MTKKRAEREEEIRLARRYEEIGELVRRDSDREIRRLEEAVRLKLAAIRAAEQAKAKSSR